MFQIKHMFIPLVLSLNFPLTAWSAVTLVCPEGQVLYATCTAYGTLGASFRPGPSAPIDPRMCKVVIIQREPYYVRLDAHRDVFPELEGGGNCTQPRLQTAFRNRLASGLPMIVTQTLPNGGIGGPLSGGWSITAGSQMVSDTDVKPGPKPVTCSMGPPLTFDFGALPPGPAQSDMSLPFPINCTAKTTGTLTLRNSPKSVIKVGNSGLVAGISANNNPLGSKIQFSKGVTNITIRAVLSGNTTSVGVQTGSGVLVLDVP
ncbi:Uncharacterised protein [Serratia proteamaculans]|nr:Uncharacterised protein [Serratia proteamaculans]